MDRSKQQAREGYRTWNLQTDYTGRLFMLNALRRAWGVAADRTYSLAERMASWENAACFQAAIEKHMERN